MTPSHRSMKGHAGADNRAQQVFIVVIALAAVLGLGAVATDQYLAVVTKRQAAGTYRAAKGDDYLHRRAPLYARDRQCLPSMVVRQSERSIHRQGRHQLRRRRGSGRRWSEELVERPYPRDQRRFPPLDADLSVVSAVTAKLEGRRPGLIFPGRTDALRQNSTSPAPKKVWLGARLSLHFWGGDSGCGVGANAAQ